MRQRRFLRGWRIFSPKGFFGGNDHGFGRTKQIGGFCPKMSRRVHPDPLSNSRLRLPQPPPKPQIPANLRPHHPQRALVRDSPEAAEKRFGILVLSQKHRFYELLGANPSLSKRLENSQQTGSVPIFQQTMIMFNAINIRAIISLLSIPPFAAIVGLLLFSMVGVTACLGAPSGSPQRIVQAYYCEKKIKNKKKNINICK